MKKLILLLCLCFLLALSFASCDNGSSASSISKDKTISIKSVGYVLENIDRTFWYSWPGDNYNTVFLSIWVYFNETDITANDIRNVIITDPDGDYWSYTGSKEIKENLNINRKYFGGWTRYTGGKGLNPNLNKIGYYTAEITLKNGKSSSYRFKVKSPGMDRINNDQFTYSEDYPSPDHTMAPMPKKAIVTASTKSTDTINIDFTIDQSMISNGYATFYDANNNSVGRTHDFLLMPSETPMQIINEGKGFYINGDTNKLTVQGQNISFFEGKSFADIDNFHIILIDGKQYESKKYYDAKSISKNYSFN